MTSGQNRQLLLINGQVNRAYATEMENSGLISRRQPKRVKLEF